MSTPFTGNHQPLQTGTSVDHDPAIAELHHFLQNAPRLWTSPSDPPVRKFKMVSGEEISCVYWKGRFFITGTDVVKILIFRFQRLGRGILNPKKFEEGVFSDLRNLKPGTEAVLEEPRSEFLEFLHKHGCIRTQKKQKVFFWHKVPHEDLFREALERNLKRVTNICNWTQMMNTPELMKQYFMMQAGQMMMQGPSGPCLVMPTPQMIPNQFMAYSSPMMATSNANSNINFNGNASGKISAINSPIATSPEMSPIAARSPQRPAVPGLRTHPRRAISISNADFMQYDNLQALNPMTPTLVANSASPGGTQTLSVPDISIALSSPMFQPEGDYNESFFDLSTPTCIDTAEMTTDAECQLDSLPETIAPAVLRHDDLISTTLKDSSTTDCDIMKELDALTTSKIHPNELVLDTCMNGDLASGDLLSDLWTDEKSPNNLNEPLWDDLSMLIPTVAPNFRGDGA